MDRIASYLEYEMAIRRMISKMMLYPVLVLLFAFAVSVGLPHITDLINKSVLDFCRDVWPGVEMWLTGAIVSLVALKLLFQFRFAKFAWDSIKIQPPIAGTAARKIAMSRFSRALALLYGSGMPIVESVSIAADASGNLMIARGIKFAIPALQAGQGLTESLRKTRAVMPMVLDMLSTGEKTGNTDAVLQKVADYMDEETDSTIHKLGTVMFVVMILIAAAVVGSIVVRFYTGEASGVMKQAQ